ncbi:MAG: phenylacetate--CoA ligase family protein [Pseudolabrys sp.]|nr:phenylacetate--CoA ligase family protein [Pseudolabrys sp.]
MPAPDSESIRLERLRQTLKAVSLAHPFYRPRFRELNIAPGSIRSLDDLQSLPLTRKEDYIADPEAFRLRAEDLSVEFSMEERVLWDICYTTGTTSGRPSPFYNTSHDAYAVWDQARRCNEVEGLTADDRVANLYPMAGFPTGAFLSVVRSTMILGLPVVHGLTGSANSEFKVRNSVSEALTTVAALRPTVLWGVPSFIRRFLDEARRRKADLSDVRMVITSGEPISTVLRNEMCEALAALGAPSIQIRARYAFTEMQGGLVQCAEHAPPQNVCPDLYYLEVVDQNSGRCLPDGESGMLAITHLHRRGTVLLRYLVGDIVTLSRAPCPICNREGERVVGAPRRTGNLVKCRSMLVNTDIIVDVLAALDSIRAFQIVFMREPRSEARDQLVIRIERSEHGKSDETTIREIVTRRLREAISLRPEVEFVSRGQLYDHERSIKSKLILDLRKQPE